MDEVANTTLPANHVHHILLADPKVDWLARLIVVCIYRKRRLRIQHRLFLVKKMLFAPNSSTPLVRLNYISVICCYLVLLSARNIPRPLFFVYRKICREFDVDHYVHKWSTDLEQQLLRLATPEIGEASIRFSSCCREYELHGNRWAIIGKALGISGSAARDKHRNITGRLRTGSTILTYCTG